MAPPTDLDLLTQMETEQSEADVVSSSVISETPFKESGHHSVTLPWSVQEVILTAAPPSDHSDKQVRQAENHYQSKLDHDSPPPQAGSLNVRAYRSGVDKANQAAKDHSPPLNDDPMEKLYAAVDELLSEGFQLDVIRQALKDHWSRSNIPHSELSTTKHTVMLIGQDSNPKEDSTTLTPDEVRGSQYNRDSSQQGKSGGEFLDKANTSSKPAKGIFFLIIVM